MPKRSSSSVKISYPPYNRDEVISQLKDKVERLNRVLPLCRVVLFGSYAKNRHTAASDIDLLVVYQGSHRDDAFSLIRRHIPLKGLEPHPYSEVDFHLMKDRLDKMTAGGVVIYPP